MLKQAEDDEFGAILCQNTVNVFLFLTDGAPSDFNSTLEYYQEYLDSQTIDYPIHLFTYSIGTGANTTLLKALSCRYQGINFEISTSSSSGELVEKMREYYVFLSHGVTIEEPIWS